MKTWQEIKDEYARETGYDNWCEFLHAEDGRLKERVVDELSLLRAKQALDNASDSLNNEWRNSIDTSYAPAHILATITDNSNIPS